MELTRRYELETALYRLNRRLETVTESRKQAKYDSRTRWEAVQLYTGSLRSQLDRLLGKQAEKEEALHRELRHAEETLAALTREKEGLEQSRQEILSQLEQLPDLQTLCAAVRETPEGESRWAKLEAAFCAEQLLPLLDKTEKALEEYRQQLRGNRMGEIVSHEQLHEIGTAHTFWGDQCAELLRRLECAMKCQGKPFEIPGYFLSPDAYIVSMAAKHNQLERMNQALKQVETLRRQTEALLQEA